MEDEVDQHDGGASTQAHEDAGAEDSTDKLDLFGTLHEFLIPFRNVSRGLVCPKETKYLMSNERHAPCANYAGPGTHYKKRIARGDDPVSNSDRAAMEHDRAYNEISELYSQGKITKEKAAEMGRIADRAMVSTIRTLNRDTPEGKKWYTAMSSQLISAKIMLEDLGILDPTKFVLS